MNPKHVVSDVLDLLAARLDGVIQTRLGDVLDGLEWTSILSQLDSIKGHSPKTYSRKDLQTQLRMLTERLGNLMFPFDDHSRTVSTLGGELRIVRNAFAHGDPLLWIDAWRAADFGVRLLEHLGDSAGAADIAELRVAALPLMANEAGLSLAAAVEEAATPAQALDEPVPGEDETPEGGPSGDDLEVPPAEAFATDVPPASVPTVGAQRQVFQPWPNVVVGPQSVVDNLPKKAAKLKVRAVATEIIEFEGPVQIERLARKTAAAFGWGRLTAKRITQIAYQIKQIEGVDVDSYGFAWPDGIKAGQWAEFRPQTGNSEREFLQISPHEIANAAAHVQRTQPTLDDHEFQRAVIAIFGRSRLTAATAKHLGLALNLLA